MNERMWLQMFGQFAGAGSGVDIAVILAFITFAIVYFLVPVVGYQHERPGGMLAALYLLAASVGVTVVQMVVNWSLMFSGRGGSFAVSGGPMGSREVIAHLTFTFEFAKLCLFVVALLAFINGLRSLHHQRLQSGSSPYGIGK